MTTKQWLESAKGITIEIVALEREKDEAALQAAKVTHDITDKIARTGRTRNDAALVKYADSGYIARIDKRLAELREQLNEISAAIYSIPPGVERMVLINLYILFKDVKDTAASMNYYPSNIYKIRDKALKRIELGNHG